MTYNEKLAIHLSGYIGWPASDILKIINLMEEDKNDR